MAVSEEKRMDIVRQVIKQYSLDYSRAHFGSPAPRTEKDMREVITSSIREILLADAMHKAKGESVDTDAVRLAATEQAAIVVQWLPVCIDAVLWGQRRL